MGIKDNVIDSMARYWFISNDNLLLLQGRFSGCSAWGWLCGTWSQSLRWFCKWADFGHAVPVCQLLCQCWKNFCVHCAFESVSQIMIAVGSVSPWSLWHEVPCRCVMDSKLSVLMLQAGELLWAILQWKEMEDLGWLKVSLEEFDDRLIRLARVYHCLKYDAESGWTALVGTLHNTDGGLDEYSGEHSAKSSMKFDVVSAKLDVFKFELLPGAKRLKIWSDTNKGSGHVGHVQK